MEITAVHLARFSVFVSTTELNPGGRLSLSDLTKGLVGRYGFAKYPKTFEEWDDQKGTEFVYGRWEQIEISRLIFFANGIVVDTRSSTDDSEKILEDLYSWATTAMGLPSRRRGDERKWYLSQLTFASDFSLDSLHPALKKLGDQITKAAASQLTQPMAYETTGVVLNLDEWNLRVPIGSFRIERLAGVPFSDKRYFSSAPLPTNEHVRLLREFEAALTGKSG